MARWIRNDTRLAIYLRDGMSCCYCGRSVEEQGVELSLDHLKPRSKGGENDPTNLITCCRVCNSARGNRPVKTFAAKVAGYLGHGVTAENILKHIRNCRTRQLPKDEAKDLMKRRGSAFRAVNWT